MSSYHLFLCFYKPKRINYIKYFFPLTLFITSFFIITNIVLIIIFPNIYSEDVFLTLLIILNLSFSALILTYYIKFLCRKNANYDYEERGIRNLALILLLAFGMSIGVFLIVVGVYSVKITQIDSYERVHNSHLVHFNE